MTEKSSKTELNEILEGINLFFYNLWSKKSSETFSRKLLKVIREGCLIGTLKYKTAGYQRRFLCFPILVKMPFL